MAEITYEYDGERVIVRGWTGYAIRICRNEAAMGYSASRTNLIEHDCAEYRQAMDIYRHVLDLFELFSGGNA